MTNELKPVIAAADSLSPFADLDAFFDDLHGRLFFPFGPWVAERALARGDAVGSRALPRAVRAAPTDLRDTGTSFKLSAEVPGIPKEKLTVRVKGSRVEIEGESDAASASEDDGVVYRERSYAGYYRAVELPEPVKAGEASATLKDGILELVLPKVEPTPAPEERQIPVQ